MPAIIPEPGYGLLEEMKLDPRDWRSGTVSGASREVIRQDGDYTDFLPTSEIQVGTYFDTLACVTFSALNVLEIIQNVRGENVGTGFSDRFTAKMSGTTHQGNFLSWVADSIRNDGVVLEDSWPYPRLQNTPVFLWEDYYSPIPASIKAEGIAWMNKWDVGHEWVPVDHETLVDALKLGPIQVTVYAWPRPDEDGVFHDDPLQPRNHAVALYKADGMNWYVFDHYDNTKKKLAWEYGFGAAKRFSLTKKVPMPTLNLLNDTLVQLVEGSGGFGLYLSGKIIIDDLAKILASFEVRNHGNTGGKVAALTKAQWDSVPHVDLRGNVI